MDNLDVRHQKSVAEAGQEEGHRPHKSHNEKSDHTNDGGLVGEDGEKNGLLI